MKQKCYFHKHQNIEKFCVLKQCTLPLCQQCLPIHQQQHCNRNQPSKIINFTTACQEALDQMKKYVQKNKLVHDSNVQKIRKDKQNSLKLITQYFQKFEKQLETEAKTLTQVSEKYNKLVKGSIKTLIYYYSGEIQLKKINQTNFKQITSELDYFLKNRQSKTQEIQTFRQKQTHLSSQNEESFKIQNQRSQSFKVKERKKSIFGESNHTRKSSYPKEQNLNYEKDQKYQRSGEKHTNQPYVEQRAKQYGEALTQQKDQWRKQQRNCNNLFFGSEVQQYQRKQTNFQKKTNLFNENRQRKPYDYKINEINNVYPNNENYFRLKEDQSVKMAKEKQLEKFPSLHQLGPKKIVKEKQNFEQPNYKRVGKLSETKKETQYSVNNWQLQSQNSDQFTYGYDRNRTNSNITPYHEPNRFSYPKNQEEKFCRKPLRTTDLETYQVTRYDSRQRAVSHQLTNKTLSHQNLPSNRKFQPSINENFKKQVLSPLQIRKMLQKRIQERNKVLSEKKDHNLKIQPRQKETFKNEEINNTPFGKLREDTSMRKTQEGSDWKHGYNTKDSIINKIYRQTRY